MPSPKNYTRKQDRENPKVPYFWESDTHYGNVTVQRFRAGDGTLYRINTVHADELGPFTSKESARKRAVKWMRRHPNP